MHYLSGQLCIREDLISQELAYTEKRLGCKFGEQKLTNRFLNWLFRHYNVAEYEIHYYDSEPDKIDALIPSDTQQNVYAYRLWREHEERRMNFNNWVDVYGEGIWGYTRKEAERGAVDLLRYARSWPVQKKGRVFAAASDSELCLYCYGRDFLGEDYWFFLERKHHKR